MVWMGLVAFGLALIFLRVTLRKNNRWLIDWNLRALLATLYAWGLINTTNLIADYNVDHSYEVTLRNLSKTGALIQVLAEVPKGTQFVVDLGGGQLAVATVIRSNGDTQGLEFEQSLVDDGSGGLCTRNRVSPYALASAGAPLTALEPGDYKAMQGGTLGQSASVPQFGYAQPTKYEAA